VKVVFAVVIAGLFSVTAMASENEESALATPDQYTQMAEAAKSSGWNYLGCASTKSACSEKAQQRGYMDSKLVYMTCTPRSADFSCFAK
jgi:hypothetical protein